MISMCSIIAELSNKINSLKQQQFRNNEPEDAFACPSYKNGRQSSVRHYCDEEYNKPTHSVNPEEWALGLPFLEYVSTKKPFGCPFMTNAARHVVIRWWIRWLEPSYDLFVYLIPLGSAWALIRNRRGRRRITLISKVTRNSWDHDFQTLVA